MNTKLHRHQTDIKSALKDLVKGCNVTYTYEITGQERLNNQERIIIRNSDQMKDYLIRFAPDVNCTFTFQSGVSLTLPIDFKSVTQKNASSANVCAEYQEYLFQRLQPEASYLFHWLENGMPIYKLLKLSEVEPSMIRIPEYKGYDGTKVSKVNSENLLEQCRQYVNKEIAKQGRNDLIQQPKYMQKGHSNSGDAFFLIPKDNENMKSFKELVKANNEFAEIF